jgi:hypothetical protein
MLVVESETLAALGEKFETNLARPWRSIGVARLTRRGRI